MKQISKLVIAMLVVTAGPWVTAQESHSQFEDPVYLKVGDMPLNEDGSMMYPSPAIFDVDNDGTDELVIGTIFGSIYACENSNTDGGEPVWERPEVVKDRDGEALNLNNW